jgi:hypothetical protein
MSRRTAYCQAGVSLLKEAARGRRVGMTVSAAVVFALVFAPAAQAAYFVTLAGAKRTVRRHLDDFTSVTPKCRPVGGKNTLRNRTEFDWHRWTCDWTGKQNGSGCHGSLTVIGHTGRGPSVRTRQDPVCPGAPPGPSPTTGGPIIDHTYAYAVSAAQAHAQSDANAYGKWTVNGCSLIQPFEGRCIIWIYTDNGVTGTDSAGQAIHRILLYRYVATSTLTYGQFFDEVNLFDFDVAAQECFTVDHATYFNCSAVRPGP